MTKKTIILFLSFLFIGALLMAGVAKEAEAGKVKASAIKMIVIVKSMENPFWESVIKGAKEAGKDLNIEIAAFAPIKPYNVEEQLRFMETGITQGVDAICIAAADVRGVVPGIEKADKAGIKVVTLSSDALSDKITSYAGAPNVDSAYRVTKLLLSKLKDNCKVINLEGTPGNQVTIDRVEGANKAIAESKKNVKLLASQTAKFSRVEGQRVMENLLQQFDEIDGVICGNDEIAIGAIEAIDAVGRLDKIMVIGFDGNNDAKDSIKAGKMLATADQRPDSTGYWGVVAAYMSIKGFPVPRKIYVPTPILTKDNIKEAVYW